MEDDNLTREVASRRMLDLCRKQSGELDGFLADIRSKVSDEDFEDLRTMVGEIMGNGYFPVMNAIASEFSKLAPEWMR